MTLLAFAIGVVAGIAIGLALGAKWRNDLREKLRISEARLDAYNLNALATDHDVAGVATPASNVNVVDWDADECRVTESGSVFHRFACDFGPDCPSPGGRIGPGWDEEDDNTDLTGWADGVHRSEDEPIEGPRALPSPRID